MQWLSHSRKKKIQKIKLKHLELYKNHHIFLLELAKVLGHLTSTIQVVLPAMLNSRFLQQQQIQALNEMGSYVRNIVLKRESKQEMSCWVKNLEI